MRVVFMGTPDFAVPALRKLLTAHEVVCVYTRAPKPAGRGNKITKTPIHLLAEENSIEVRTPKTLRGEEEQSNFAALKADVAVVAAYGLILPKPILEAFPLGCLNIHASLLPRWRGAAPIQRAIEAGDKQSGITIMQVAEGLDTGDMLLKGKIDITPDMTGGELHDLMANLGGELIIDVLENIEKYKPVAQIESEATYAQKLEKAECLLDLKQSVMVLHRKIRAFSPFPAMYFEYKGERFKIIRACFGDVPVKIGCVKQENSSLYLGCADGSLQILELQRQGKKSMLTEDLLRGFSFPNEDFLL